MLLSDVCLYITKQVSRSFRKIVLYLPITSVLCQGFTYSSIRSFPLSSVMNSSGNRMLESVSNVTLLPYYMHSARMALGYVLLYILVCVVCVGGNTLVCVVVLTNRNMRSVTNLFILNLVISDLLVGAVCVPTTLIDSLISGDLQDVCLSVCLLFCLSLCLFVCTSCTNRGV